MEQFKALRLNFRPSTVLKAKIDAVDLEMEGVYKCLDLTADNKVYERIVQPESVTPDDNGNQGGSNQGGGGDDLVG
jgi:hypothetical protein